MDVLTYRDWRETCITLHMVLQMIGKVKLGTMDPQPEWKHVVLHPDAEGFTTGLLPAGSDGFEIRLSTAKAEVSAETALGKRSSFSLANAASVSERYASFKAMLDAIGHPCEINPTPQEMFTDAPFDKLTKPCAFDANAARRSFRQFLFARKALSRFSAPFRGKKVDPSLFWGTFDLTTVLFSGKPCPYKGDASLVERVAFDEQFVEFGFWPGDESTNDPAFFALAYPFLQVGSSKDVSPRGALYDAASAEYFFPLKDVVASDDPEAAVLRFCSDAFNSIAKREGWDRMEWFTKPLLNA